MTSERKGPQRSCVSCRENQDQGNLIRYVVAPDGNLLVDYRHRLPGRGAYTCVSLDCLQKAVERKQFQRSFRGKCQRVELADLRVQINQALEQRIISLIGMARKSGQLITGSSAVLQAMKKTDIAVVLVSQDISETIAEKVRVLSAHLNISCYQLLSKDLLGQIAGKGERSVVAVECGTLADTLLIELHRHEQMVRENDGQVKGI